MESLYTKYRPQTFEQVVGQSHVVETLKRAVLEGRTSHAYLFCGPRGTGKTRAARARPPWPAFSPRRSCARRAPPCCPTAPASSAA